MGTVHRRSDGRRVLGCRLGAPLGLPTGGVKAPSEIRDFPVWQGMMAPGNDGRRAQTKATTRSKAPAKAGVYFVRAICQLAPRLAASRLTAARLFERLDQSTSRGVGAGAGRTIRLASSAALGELGTRPSPRSPPTAHPPRKGAGARRASISPDRSTVLRDRDQRHNFLSNNSFDARAFGFFAFSPSKNECEARRKTRAIARVAPADAGVARPVP